MCATITISISRTFSSYWTETLYSFKSNFHAFLSSDLSNRYSLFCLYEFDCSRYLIPVESYNTCWFFFWHLSSVTSHNAFKSQSCCTLHLNFILFFEAELHSIVCADHNWAWIASTFWLLWIMLLCTLVYNLFLSPHFQLLLLFFGVYIQSGIVEFCNSRICFLRNCVP